MNRIFFIIISLLAMVYIIHDIRKKRFTIKESFWWIASSIAMLLLAIFPRSIDHLAKMIGVSYAPSLLFVFCIMFLVLMVFRNSKRISEQQVKIVELAQNIAILKEEVGKKDKK